MAAGWTWRSSARTLRIRRGRGIPMQFDRLNRRGFAALVAGAGLAPLAAAAQERGRVYRLGAMIPVGRETPGIMAFFDEMRLFGFVDGQNLAVLANGFGVRNDELAERAEALV